MERDDAGRLLNEVASRLAETSRMIATMRVEIDDLDRRVSPMNPDCMRRRHDRLQLPAWMQTRTGSTPADLCRMDLRVGPACAL